MKRMGVFYATREGQTKRIADYVAAIASAEGFEMDVYDVRNLEDDVTVRDYAGIVFAASLHTGKYEREMAHFLEEHREGLRGVPTCFISVSLTEATVEKETATTEEKDRALATLKLAMDKLFEYTGWHPDQIKSVAGALAYSKYNFVLRFLMKQIAKHEGGSTDTSHDYEYTDWVSLKHFIEEFAGSLETHEVAAHSALVAF